MNEAEIRKRLVRATDGKSEPTSIATNGSPKPGSPRLEWWWYTLCAFIQLGAFINFSTIAARGGFTLLLASFGGLIVSTGWILWRNSAADDQLIVKRALARVRGVNIAERTTFERMKPFLLANVITMAYMGVVVFQPYLFRQAHALKFVRVGAVTHNSVHLWIRYPPDEPALGWRKKIDWALSPGMTPYSTTRNVAVEWRKDEDDWNLSAQVTLEPKHDYASAILIENLDSDTRYEYRWTSNDKVLTFQPLVKSKGVPLPNPTTFYFKTAPSQAIAKMTNYSFGFGSCIKPDWPFSISGILGFRQISKFIQKNPLDLFIFLGDWIYADAPFVFGSQKHHFDHHYRRNLEVTESWFLATTPSYFVIDDHDVRNNWNKQDSPPYGTAVKAYNDYCGVTNPPSHGKPYYHFQYADSAFFVMDTRRYRDDDKKTMLGEAQLEDLFSWMASTRNPSVTWRFIASSVPFTFNWRFEFGADDTWYGFQDERRRVFDKIREHNLTNVVLLSGDRHLVCVNEFDNVTQAGPKLIEFSASPINQFVLMDATRQVAEGEHKLFSYARDSVQWGRIQVSRNGTKSELTMELYAGTRNLEPKWSYTITAI
jgi:alkaline phosphatase D